MLDLVPASYKDMPEYKGLPEEDRKALDNFIGAAPFSMCGGTIERILDYEEGWLEESSERNDVDVSELPTCPFCGAAAKAYIYRDPIDGAKYYSVNCLGFNKGCNTKVGPYDTNEKALAAWIRRVPKL